MRNFCVESQKTRVVPVKSASFETADTSRRSCVELYDVKNALLSAESSGLHFSQVSCSISPLRVDCCATWVFLLRLLLDFQGRSEANSFLTSIYAPACVVVMA